MLAVAGEASGEGPSHERAAVLPSTSGGDRKEAGMEAAVRESSCMPRLVKKCTLLECEGEAGDFGMGLTAASVRTQLLFLCYGSFKALVNRRRGWRQLQPQAG